MSEKALIDGIREGNRDAMERFMALYGPLIRYIIAPILSDERDREECLSDVALAVWNRIGAFDPAKSSFHTWISVIARNAAVDRVRRLPPAMEELNGTLASVVGDPEEAVRQQEVRQMLRKALQTLREGELRLFYRKYYYFQPTGQIAAELGMTVRSVEGKLYRIRMKLKKELMKMTKGVRDDV